MSPSKPRRVCIFCGENFANSKEHFYPQWMAPLLAQVPVAGPSYIEHFIVDDPFEETVNENRKEKPGALATKKIRSVCQRCNNGWMNAVEQAARASLTSFILGEPVALTPDQQAMVARWFALKVLVIEHGSNNTAVHPSSVRLAVRDGTSLPTKFNVYVGKHTSTAKTGLVRQTGLVSGAKTSARPNVEQGITKNIQQITFLLGQAFAHINSSTADVELENFLDYSNLKPARLWPPTDRPFVFPAGRVLDNAQLNNLGWSLNAVLRGPHTRVGDRRMDGLGA